MNTTILQKCVEELRQEKPKIDYILGMLETVIEMSSITQTQVPQYKPEQWTGKADYTSLKTQVVVADEGLEDEFMKQYVGGPIGNLA